MAKETKKNKKDELERFRERILAIKEGDDVEGVSERQKLESMNDLKNKQQEKQYKES